MLPEMVLRLWRPDSHLAGQVDPHSKVEKLLAIAAMAPYFIMCALATLIVRCRELLVCSWLVGHLINEVLNFVLKRTFKEKRPDGAPAVG